MPSDTVEQSTRWALVTGSTSGIGRATALALAGDGFSIIVTGVTLAGRKR
jgi:NAD(P)-dependent dehydrogenase (short-subunit alcohol dehydrogenase family)